MKWTAKFYGGRWWTREEWAEAIKPSVTVHAIRADGMSDTVNPVNGKTYDSKSAYYKAVRAAGCEIMGNEAPTQMRDRTPAPQNVERDIARAIQQLRG